LISASVGWRKPHRKIFDEALKRLQVVDDEVVFVGDSPFEDIKGAKAAGLKTGFVPSQFYSVADLAKFSVEPDVKVRDLQDLCRSIFSL
jgi:putative hydrolase of the HAD superfamily